MVDTFILQVYLKSIAGPPNPKVMVSQGRGGEKLQPSCLSVYISGDQTNGPIVMKFGMYLYLYFLVGCS